MSTSTVSPRVDAGKLALIQHINTTLPVYAAPEGLRKPVSFIVDLLESRREELGSNASNTQERNLNLITQPGDDHVQESASHPQ